MLKYKIRYMIIENRGYPPMTANVLNTTVVRPDIKAARKAFWELVFDVLNKEVATEISIREISEVNQ